MSSYAPRVPATPDSSPASAGTGDTQSQSVAPGGGGTDTSTAGAPAPAAGSTAPNPGPEQRTSVTGLDLLVIGGLIVAGDLGALGSVLDHADDIVQWLVDNGHCDIVLQLAGGVFSASIRTSVENRHLLDRIIAGGAIDGQVAHQGLFALIGDATTRPRGTLDAAYAKLFPSTRLLRAGQVPVTAWGTGIAWTNTAATPNATYRVAKRAVSVDPTDASMGLFFNIMRNVPRSGLAATNTLQFAAQEEYYWAQDTPATSPEWRPWTPSVRRDMVTSYAGSGIVVLYALGDGATTMETARAADGTVSQTGVMNFASSGDVDGTHIGSDSDGTATSVGGGEDRRSSGGTDNRTIPGGLTYFQNHAVHEFGHSVGASKYTNVPQTGNQFAEGYGGWRKLDPAAFQTAMFTATDGDTLTDPAGGNHAVTAADVAAWLMGVLRSGAEPTGNAVTAIAGATVSQKLGMLTASAKYGNEELVKYVRSLAAQFAVGGIPNMAYQYTGYSPSGNPKIYCERWDSSFAEYSSGAYTACKTALGWYSMASPVEMFAEAYTSKYAGGGLPAPQAGQDFAAFFDQLEQSPSVETPAGAAPALLGSTPAQPMQPGETPPPTTIVPGP